MTVTEAIAILGVLVVINMALYLWIGLWPNLAAGGAAAAVLAAVLATS